MQVARSISSAVESIAIVATSRLELFAAEVSLEKSRLSLLACAVIVSSGSLLLALASFVACLILLTPPDYRPLTAGLCTLLFLGLCIASAWIIFAMVRDRKLPFANTCSEIRKDIQCLASVVRKES